MELIHRELSYQVIGALYKVYNSLGYGYKEKEYQKAFEEELKALGIKYKRELYSKLSYNGKVITGFFVDFQIDDKLIVELKVAEGIYQKHFNQVLAYLKNFNLDLGIVAAFTSQRIIIKRIINQRSAKLA
ncbi:MAG: GxxExxY protein [Candidatus Doudnabacteria bacterium]|nr:GxxExxY protein [Candidatus Doudnabacteria bacterium]